MQLHLLLSKMSVHFLSLHQLKSELITQQIVPQFSLVTSILVAEATVPFTKAIQAKQTLHREDGET